MLLSQHRDTVIVDSPLLGRACWSLCEGSAPSVTSFFLPNEITNFAVELKSQKAGGSSSRFREPIPSSIAGSYGPKGRKMSGRSQMTAMNGKRPSSMPVKHQPETLAQHFDLIKYICDSWNSVSRELDMCYNQPHLNSSNYRNGTSVTYYQECEPNPQLKDFEPFDLEAWWGKRVVQSITRNASS